MFPPSTSGRGSHCPWRWSSTVPSPAEVQSAYWVLSLFWESRKTSSTCSALPGFSKELRTRATGVQGKLLWGTGNWDGADIRHGCPNKQGHGPDAEIARSALRLRLGKFRLASALVGVMLPRVETSPLFYFWGFSPLTLRYSYPQDVRMCWNTSGFSCR